MSDKTFYEGSTTVRSYTLRLNTRQTAVFSLWVICASHTFIYAETFRLWLARWASLDLGRLIHDIQ